MKTRGVILLFILLFQFSAGFTQVKKVAINGYVSGLYTIGYDDVNESWNNFSKFNNRLNLTYWPTKALTLNLEIQNRLYAGSYLEQFPGLKSSMTSSSDYFNLSHTWTEDRAHILQTRIDRLFLDYTIGKVSIRAGRQRINWGQTLVWNVNDIFNNYAIFEIDNLERYGCDAIHVSLFTSPVSVVEAAIKVNADARVTSAVMTRFNFREVDFQLQGGLVDETDLMAGAGVTGELSGFTIRAEGACYLPLEKTESNQSVLLVSTGVDYLFPNNMMLQAEVLYNQLNDPDLTGLFLQLFAAPASSRALSISTWSYAVNWMYPVSQRFDVGLSTFFFTDYTGVYLSPSVDFKLMKNLDLTGVCQVYTMDYYGVRNTLSTGTLRLKYHF